MPLEDSIIVVQPSMEADVAIRDLLGRLPKSQQSLLELVYVAGFSHAEIAAMSGSTPGAVKTALYRARQAMQAMHDLQEKEQANDRR